MRRETCERGGGERGREGRRPLLGFRDPKMLTPGTSLCFSRILWRGRSQVLPGDLEGGTGCTAAVLVQTKGLRKVSEWEVVGL